jgi:hypothetical protein
MNRDSVVDALHWLDVVVVFQSQGVDTRIDSKRLAHRDTSRAFRDNGASMLLLPGRSVPIIVRAVQKVICIIVSAVCWDIFHDFLIIKVVVIVVREFV